MLDQDAKDKYSDFKDKILNEFHETKKQPSYREPASSNKKQRVSSSYKKNPNEPLNNRFS